MVKFAALILVFLSISLEAQNITVKASVDSSRYRVGDYINYSIRVSAGKDFKILQPSIKDSLKTAELISVKPAVKEQKDNQNITVFNYIISKYDSGDAIIPSIPVRYISGKDTLQVNTNQVYFTVTTLKVDQRAEIKDVKDPIRIPMDWRLILLYVLIGLIVIAAGIYLYRYYRRKKAIEQGIIKIVIKEPHEEALDSLKILEEKKLWQQGLVKQYHTEITEIIRKYFEGRFEIPALEITSGELVYNLKKVKEADGITQIVTDFLNNADQVKFAKFVPMNSINEEMLKQAYEIVNRTIPVKQAEPLEVSDVH